MLSAPPDAPMKVTADDIAQLLASSPPRRVPAQVAREIRRQGTTWFVPLLGLAFGSFGLVFVFFFFPWRFPDEWRLASNEARTTQGIITDVRASNMTINKTRVMEYGFQYTPEDGLRRQGRCFTTGKQWYENAAVTVRYLPANPALACVENARLSKGGWSGAFVIIFPLAGGGLVGWFIVDRRRKTQLLQEGRLTEVEVLSVDETQTRVNNRSVFKIVITSPDLQAGRPVVIKRLNRQDIDLAGKHLREKQPVFVLYDPRNPTRVLFPEALIAPE